MSRALLVQSVATVSGNAKEAAQKVRIANGQEMGNVQSMKRRVTVSTPQQLANARNNNSQAAQSARIAELENDLQNLWQHYASSRKQKLELLDVNSSLETEICQLKKDLAYEVHMRAKAEAKLEIENCELE